MDLRGLIVHLLINWMLSALALWLVARIVPGVYVRDYGAALIATIVIAIVNTLLGWPLHILTFPMTILTLGLFWLVVNAFLLKLASMLVPGFTVQGFFAAFFGSILLTVLQFILGRMIFPHGGLLY
ncbi:MAG TPA: phage holin family protein [Bryobacteraceae bacterium]|nr:phage holin family protein [Bryobacteraceae bacterium]